MANPPFFSDTFNDSSENNSATSKSFFHNKKVNTPCDNEAIVEGGEISFIKNIINESFQVKDSVDLYTVMVGRKKSFLELKQLLEEYVQEKTLSSFTHSELCQGNTKRWSIAWTFHPNIDLSKAHKIKHFKSKPLIHFIPKDIQCTDYTLKSLSEYIHSLFVEDLKITSISLFETKKYIEFEIKSNTNTWTNQRKKRRQQAAQNQCERKNNNNSDVFRIKRQLDNEDCDGHTLEKKSKDTFDLCKSDLTYLLHCSVKIKREKQEMFIKMLTKEKSQNKESTFQVFQYLKNKLV